MKFNTSSVSNPDVYQPLISHELKEIFYTVLYAIVGATVCSLGIVTNTMNIVVFAKQGFNETVNVSLFALAISDLGAVITLLWVCICVNPLFKYSDIPFMAEGVHYITGAWPHTIFMRITGWLTALITVERCLCVIFPLKVKTILTLGRIKGIVVAIYLLVIASMSPAFYTTRLAWTFVPQRNRTLVGVVNTPDKADIDSVATYVNGVVPSMTYFFLVSASTIILVVNLKRQTKWRQQTSSAQGHDKDHGTNRDKKVIKMVISLAAIFIACLLPHMVAEIPVAVDPEFSVIGKRRNMFKVAGSITLTCEAVSSSVNIFIYYNMSSKYKTTFHKTFLTFVNDKRQNSIN